MRKQDFERTYERITRDCECPLAAYSNTGTIRREVARRDPPDQWGTGIRIVRCVPRRHACRVREVHLRLCAHCRALN